MSCTDTGGATLERAMIARAKARGVPINGSLELLPLCNLNCDMCYVRLSRAEQERQGRLRTAEEWLALGREMAGAGVLFLLLTGGEPLLYPDFKEVYLGLRALGFVLTLNTNATLMDEGWADFFAAHPPRRINVTLYGAGAAEYGALCHNPEGYERTLRGIRLLRARGLDVKVSVSVTRVNRASLGRMFQIGEELDAPVHIDPYMMPAARERGHTGAREARVPPEEAAAVSLEALKLQFPPETVRDYARQAVARVDDPGFPRGDGHLSCLAGSCSFTVNWQGELRPCVVMTEPAAPVFEVGFRAAWEAVSAASRALRISETCVRCRYQPICKVCAAAALVETGSYQGVPDYLCRFSAAYDQLLREELHHEPAL